MKILIATVFTTLAVLLAFANNPGGHIVTLTWSAYTGCPSGATCTLNVYRSTGAGSTPCAAGATPTFTGIPSTATSYQDTTVAAATTYVYAMTALPSTGGESPCSGQSTASVSSVSAGTITQVSATAQ